MPDEQTDDPRLARLKVGAAFGLMFAVLLASDFGFVVGFAAAVGIGLALGERFPGDVGLVGVGVMGALLLYAVIGAQIATGAASEWRSTEKMVDAIATFGILVATLVAYLVGSRRRPARLAAERGDAVLGAAGLLVAAGAAVTVLALFVMPATRSFELAAMGWAPASDGAMPEQARLRFEGLVAVYVPDDASRDRSGPAAMVGVLNASGTTYGCHAVFDPWPGTQLLHGTVVENGEVTLPAGPATRVHLTVTPRGEDAYLYFLRRSRLTGLAHEDLCYLLAVVSRPGVRVDAQIADGLADAFRFR